MILKLIFLIATCETFIFFLLKLITVPENIKELIDIILLSISVAFFSKQYIFSNVLKNEVEDFETALDKVEALNKSAIVSITDEFGKIKYVNQLFCEISGYQKDELIGKDHRILNSSHHSKDYIKNMWSTINSGEIWRGEFQNKRKNGEFYWVYSNIIPLFNKKNKMFISIRFDITSKKILEESLKEEQLKTMHLGKLTSIGEMSSNIAHEINNPLSVVLGRIDVIKHKLKKKLDLSEGSLDLDFEKLTFSVNRISKIIKTLRDFSRQDVEQEPPSNVSINSIILPTLDLINEKAKNKGIQIELNLIDEFVFCVPIQIEQVLINLLNNSIFEVAKFEEKWIKIETKIIDDFIEFSVIDSGTGIPQEIQQKLTLPFFTTKPVGEGTGLGLNISKKIIESNLGKFYYDDKSKNTKFSFLLPKNQSAIIGILNIEETISSHLQWKQKLLNELTNNTITLDPKIVSDCKICNLGKWISKSTFAFTNNNNFTNLIEKHKVFHESAGDILRRIHEGKLNSSDEFYANDSNFEKHSNNVVIYLTALINEYKNKNLQINGND